MDSTTVDRRIESLRPEFRPLALKWLHIVRDDIEIDVRITETLRSEERQRAVQAAGASKVKFGWHNVGLALDFGVLLNGVYQKDDRAGLYRKCGHIGEALGMRWGGNWDADNIINEPGENDLGHFEWHPGMTLQQFLAAQQIGIVKA